MTVVRPPRSALFALFIVVCLTLVSIVPAVSQSESASIPLRFAWGTFDPLTTEPASLIPDTSLRLSAQEAASANYYVVQFHGPIREADKATVTSNNVDLLTYVPEFGFIARMDADTAQVVEDLKSVRWVGVLQPAFRISPELVRHHVRTQEVTRVEITVITWPDVNVDAVARQIAGLGGTIQETSSTRWKSTLRVRIDSSRLTDIATIGSVQWIEADYPVELFNGDAVEVTNVENVWDTHGLYGEGQLVAVADTGFDDGSATPGSMHVDFEDGSSGSRVLTIYDTANDGNVADDSAENGHGTHVAGTVLGNGLSSNSGSTASDPTTNSFGNDTDAGAAPKATLVFQALEHNTNNTFTTPTDLNTLFEPPYTNEGARIHTNSWGSAVDGLYTSKSRDVDEFTWDHRDMLILFAAGNDGEDANADGIIELGSIGAPATAKNAMTVGASENNRPSITTTYFQANNKYSTNPIRDDRRADDVDGLAAFSSRGYTDDGRTKPDIVAPGTHVRSTCAEVMTGCNSGDYQSLSGTSMATPHVAGAAALTREFFVERRTITPTGTLLKAALLNGATDIHPGQYGTGATQEITQTRPSPQAGWGRLDIERSLFPQSPYRTWYWDVDVGTGISYTHAGLRTGDSMSHTFEVTQTGTVSATLAWSDYPGSLQTSGALVNDLDLRIDGPGGPYYPNNARQKATYYLSYHDGLANGGIAWSAQDYESAVRFTPGRYPAEVSSTQFRMYADTAETIQFGVDVYGDGAGGAPGAELCSQDISHTFAAGWQNVTIDLSTCNGGSPVSVNSGDIYIAFRQVEVNKPYIGFDTDSPIDNRSWDNLGSWSQNTDEDYLITAGFTEPGTNYDRVNNVVGIDIPNAGPGVYTATVDGYNIPFGPQPYAVVLSAPARLLGTETVTRTVAGPNTYIFGNTGISMTFGSEDIDTVAVTVYRDQFPTGNPSDPVIKRSYDITANGGTGSFDAAVAFSYEDAELNGFSEENLEPYRWNGNSWTKVAPYTVNTINNVVTVNNVTSFSRWTLGGTQPTAITMSTARTSETNPALWIWAITALAMIGIAIISLIAFRTTTAE